MLCDESPALPLLMGGLTSLSFLRVRSLSLFAYLCVRLQCKTIFLAAALRRQSRSAECPLSTVLKWWALGIHIIRLNTNLSNM